MQNELSIKERIWRTLHLKRALLIVWRSGRGWMIVSGLLLVVQGLLPLLTLYLIKLVVDQVALAVKGTEGQGSFGEIALLIGCMGATALAAAVCRTLSSLVSEAQAIAVGDHVHDILHAKSVEVDLEYYENSEYYDTLHRAQREAAYRSTRIVNGFITIGRNGLSLLAMAALLLSFHWAVVAVLFVAAVPGLFVRMRFAKKMYRWQRERTPLTRYAHYFHYLLTRDAYAKEVRLFDLGGLFQRRYRDLRRRLREEWFKIAKKRSLSETVTQASFTVAIFGSYAFIAHEAMGGAITLGDLFMYFQAVQRGQGFLQQALGGLSGLYEDNLFLSNLTEFLNLKTRVKEPENPVAVPRPLRGGIAVEGVDFRYPTGTREVLEGITLRIEPGEHVALVGENGSGKTTLVKLLCRLYDPTSGKITLDDVNLRDFGIAPLRREIGVILQDYARYHLEARENIRLGNIGLGDGDGVGSDPGVVNAGIGAAIGPGNEGTIEAAVEGEINAAIEDAAKQSGAHAVIEELPEGYETILGKWFETGEELSVGEWQKIALARAYLRDAQILILDEPTSSMDARAEFEVFRKFSELSEGRTTILISHRLSTVRMADRIFVMDRGRIVETGTHDDLMRCDGRYRELFETQASNYR